MKSALLSETLQRPIANPVVLSGGGPFRLPDCSVASAQVIDAETVELHLDTKSGQRVLVPLSAHDIPNLRLLAERILERLGA